MLNDYNYGAMIKLQDFPSFLAVFATIKVCGCKKGEQLCKLASFIYLLLLPFPTPPILLIIHFPTPSTFLLLPLPTLLLTFSSFLFLLVLPFSSFVFLLPLSF